jgi:hypothetical protein
MLKIFIFLTCLFFFSCSRNTQIGENEFIHDDKVFKIVDNEILFIGNLNETIRKYEIETPELKDYGISQLDYIKKEAFSDLKALYRGDYLYYILSIKNLNDLKEKYSEGKFTISFIDQFGFILHEIEITTSDLIGMIGDDNKTIIQYSYNGKTQMSQDIFRAISMFDISSTVRKYNKSSYDSE